MKQVELKTLKQGELFQLKDNENAPLWVKSEYDRSQKKFFVYKYEDINHGNAYKGSRLVFVD